MIIRIVFENINSAETIETMQELTGSPSGTCLSSSNSIMMQYAKTCQYMNYFWYLDVNILNKYYGGVRACLNSLSTYSGVKSVDVVSLDYTREYILANLDAVRSELMHYVDLI